MTTAAIALVLGLLGFQEKGQWVPISESVTSKVEQKWPFLAAGIAVDPASGDVYLVISGAGLWKSQDHGKTFEQVDAGKVGGRCETGAAISVDPMGGGRLAFFQLDGKAAWTPDGGTPAMTAAAGASISSRWTGRIPRRGGCGACAMRAVRSGS